MAIFQGFDTDTNERVFVPGADNSAFTDDLVLTPEWTQLATKFDLQAKTNGTVEDDDGEARQATGLDVVNFVLASVPGPKLMSTVQSKLRALLEQKGFTRFGNLVPVVETPIEEVPVDRNGRVLSAAQVAWGEMTRWSQTASSREIEDRRRTDPAYASFHRKNLEREMAETTVGDGAQNLNSPVKRNEAVASELVREFAKLHRELPAERLRPKAGYIVLGSMRLTKPQFDDLVEKSTQAGLL